MEKLSVIVPVYNVYPYLRECLDSIINQTYKNLEIIVVNDASPYIEDDAICKEYALKDNRIIYIKHEENKGLGGARNTGINTATGKYITFVDSDDYLCDMKGYEDIITTMEKNGYNYVIFDYTVIKLDGTKINVSGANKYYKKGRKINPDKWDDEYVVNKIFLTKVLRDNNIYFEEKLKYEDVLFIYKYTLTVNPTIYWLNKTLYVYRMHEGSITYTSKNILDKAIVNKKVVEIVEECNEMSKYRKNIVKRITNFSNHAWKLDKETKQQYIEDYKRVLHEENITVEEIRKYCTMDFITQFIEDEEIRQMCNNVLAPFNKIENKILPANKYVYKIKREIMRVVRQIKGIFTRANR